MSSLDPQSCSPDFNGKEIDVCSPGRRRQQQQQQQQQQNDTTRAKISRGLLLWCKSIRFLSKVWRNLLVSHVKIQTISVGILISFQIQIHPPAASGDGSSSPFVPWVEQNFFFTASGMAKRTVKGNYLVS